MGSTKRLPSTLKIKAIDPCKVGDTYKKTEKCCKEPISPGPNAIMRRESFALGDCENLSGELHC